MGLVDHSLEPLSNRLAITVMAHIQVSMYSIPFHTVGLAGFVEISMLWELFIHKGDFFSCEILTYKYLQCDNIGNMVTEDH